MLSVVIVNWNTRDALRACLASLQRSEPQLARVIVVDNASKDGSAEMVRAEFPEVKLIESGKNLGYAAGNNLGFLHATEEFILTLNPDTEVGPESLRTAVEILQSAPAYGSLSCRFIGPDGNVQASVRAFPTYQAILDEIKPWRKRHRTYRLPNFDYQTEQPCPQPMGTFILFRREALVRVGDPNQPFDERFPIFFNEVDLLYRLQNAGFPSLFTPQVEIKHHGGLSTRQVRREMIWESHNSLYRFFEKHTALCSPAQLRTLKRLLKWGAWIRARGTSEGFRP